MPYQVMQTLLEGVLVLEPKVFSHARGLFFESFNARDFAQTTKLEHTFVQDNHGKSAKAMLRGLHYQTQHAQGKLVRLTQGAVFDVAVDTRKGSITLCKWCGIELSTENNTQLWISDGLAHGFFVTWESAELLYKTTNIFYPEFERSILWNDPSIGIEWPLHLLDAAPLLAPKDANSLGIESI
jgi:dTDP-4-dehydrorhamnose 3,5-epimerase